METVEQGLIIRHGDGHSKVFACPGSGKTFVLTHRNKYLIEELGISPYRIVNVMFNTDAAEGFRKRLREIITDGVAPHVFTFNGLGAELLRKAVAKGWRQEHKLITSEGGKFVTARATVQRWAPQGVKGHALAVREFIRFVDLFKSSQQEASEIFKDPIYEFAPKHSFFIEALDLFEATRKEDRFMYFSDQIYDIVELFKSNEDAVKEFGSRYGYVNVDEYQDISQTQQLLIKFISGAKANVMAVGDDDQCIYTWRGAKPSFLLEGFDKDFLNPTVYTLSRTFRNGHAISMAAASLIRNNSVRKDKTSISSESAFDTSIVLDEANAVQDNVSQHLGSWLAQGRSLSEAAVLVRAYSAAIPVEMALLTAGIPYVLDGGDPVLNSEDIGSLVYAIHLAANEAGSLKKALSIESIMRFLMAARTNITDTDAKRFKQEIEEGDRPAISILQDLQFREPEPGVQKSLNNLYMAWMNIVEIGEGASAIQAFETIVGELKIDNKIEIFSKDEDDAAEKRARLEAFRSYVIHHGGTIKDLSVHLRKLQEQSYGEEEDVLKILSVHRSKGLEWPLVIIPNLRHGKFPLIRKNHPISEEGMEDERRLFFVAITRAQEKLILIVPKDGMLERSLGLGLGRPDGELTADSASLFVYETNLFAAQSLPAMISGEVEVDYSTFPDGELFKTYIEKFKANKKQPA